VAQLSTLGITAFMKISRRLQGCISGFFSGLLAAFGWYVWMYSCGRRETLLLSREQIRAMILSDLKYAACIFLAAGIIVAVAVIFWPRHENRDTHDA
jgi:hypothetical protein